jgi:hypothetical protein
MTDEHGHGHPYMVVTGDLIAGHSFIGPFTNSTAAATFAARNFGEMSWIILPLCAPSDVEEQLLEKVDHQKGLIDDPRLD